MDQIHTPQPVALPALEGDDDLDVRQCGRCRLVFEDDPTLVIQGRRDWSLCRPCEAILFPKRVRSGATLTLVPPLAGSDNQKGPS